MENENTALLAEQPAEDLLAWHRPRLERLVVTIDTALGGGSDIDGEGGDEFPSDVSLKTNVADIKGALRGILALHGVTYRYDTSGHPDMELAKGPQIGFLAQEVERIYPELVTTKKGFKAIKYAQLVPVLVEAIKQQQSMIAALQDQVSELNKTRTPKPS